MLFIILLEVSVSFEVNFLRLAYWLFTLYLFIRISLSINVRPNGLGTVGLGHTFFVTLRIIVFELLFFKHFSFCVILKNSFLLFFFFFIFIFHLLIDGYFHWRWLRSTTFRRTLIFNIRLDEKGHKKLVKLISDNWLQFSDFVLTLYNVCLRWIIILTCFTYM